MGKDSPLCRSLVGNETQQFLAAKLRGCLCSVAPCSRASPWCCACALAPRLRFFLALLEFLEEKFRSQYQEKSRPCSVSLYAEPERAMNPLGSSTFTRALLLQPEQCDTQEEHPSSSLFPTC